MSANASKFNRVLNALTVLALVLGFVLMPAMPASAALTNGKVTVHPTTAGAPAYYRMDFHLSSAVESGGADFVEIRFPDEVTVPDDLKTNLKSMAIAFTSDAGADLDYYPEIDNAVGKHPAEVKYDPLNDHNVRLFPNETIEAATQVKVEFFGPEWTNPTDLKKPTDEVTDNAGIINPVTVGTFQVCVTTSEEPMFLVCDSFTTTVGPPVQLYLKRQVPTEQCGYTELEYVKDFSGDGAIQEALDAANGIWEQTAEYTDDFPRWNLFDGCPTLDTISKTIALAAKPIPVGALIKVAPGIYNETLKMDTPGVILASTGGAAVTTIDAGGEAAEASDPITSAVAIEAGGITLGASTIHRKAALGDLELGGFTISAGGMTDNPDAYGVGVKFEASDKCVAGVDVFSSTVQFSGTVGADGTFTVTGFDNTSWISTTGGASGFYTDQKLVNLNTGWSFYVKEISGTKGITATLALTQPTANASAIVTVTEYITDDNFLVVFSPTVEYTCTHARVDIRDNVIHGATLAGIGAFDTAIWVDGNEVYGNDTDGFYGENLRCCGVMVCDGTGRTDDMLRISKNTFHDNGDGEASDWANNVGTEDECFDFEGAGNDAGIHVKATIAGNNGCDDAWNIVGNETYDNAHAGIWLDEEAAECYLTITQNKIYSNAVFGLSSRVTKTLLVSDTNIISVTVQFNDVYNNGFWGVKNWAPTLDLVTDTLEVKRNYWGSAGGPSDGPAPCAHQHDQRSDALGSGDATSEGTFWNPWLTESYVTVLDEGKRYYGSDTLSLAKGWNTLAVPLSLYDKGDTIPDIALLGDFLAHTNIVYQYDPGAGWKAIGSTSDKLIPCRGYYIHTTAAGDTFPVLYDNGLGLPSYDLVAGWNLVGSAFGIDRTRVFSPTVEQGEYAVADPDSVPPDAEATQYVTETLECLTWGNNNGVANIVSPGVPGQIDGGWSRSWNQLSGKYMHTGEGYWVFMREAATLAGFEITPLYGDVDWPTLIP